MSALPGRRGGDRRWRRRRASGTDALAGTGGDQRGIGGGLRMFGDDAQFPVTGSDPSPATSFEHGMSGDRRPILEDADLAGQRVYFDDALPGGVGNAVEIAADRDHSFVGNATLQFEH
jgi:hypothetical protein